MIGYKNVLKILPPPIIHIETTDIIHTYNLYTTKQQPLSITSASYYKISELIIHTDFLLFIFD